MRDLFATLLKDVCHDVEVEPHLETLTGEVPTRPMKLDWISALAVSGKRGRRHSLM